MEDAKEIVSISDPGKVGQEEHNWGDRFSVATANIFAWIFPILIIAIVSQVFLRGAGNNQAWLDDLQWWLYGAAVMVGIAYAVTTNSHVRVDIFYASYSENKRSRIEIFGLVWLFLPFIILSWDMSLHYAIASVQSGEGSDSPNGLHRLYLLKVFMNISFILMGIAVWSAYVRYLNRLTEPNLWKQLLFAFPSTMYLINLAVFYGLYWFVYLTGGEDLNPRQITRQPAFEPVMIFGFEMLKTVLAAFILTWVLIVAAWMFDRRKDGTV